MGKIIDKDLRSILRQERMASITSSPEELLADLRDVGPNKPMGYLPVSTITDNCNTTPEALVKEAREKGLKAAIFIREPTVLAVWDENALQNLLSSRISTLTDAGWPTKANEFAKHVFEHRAEPQAPLFDLIADAYADYRNPLRLELGDPPSSTTSHTDRNKKRDPLVSDNSSWAKGPDSK